MRGLLFDDFLNSKKSTQIQSFGCKDQSFGARVLFLRRVDDDRYITIYIYIYIPIHINNNNYINKYISISMLLYIHMYIYVIEVLIHIYIYIYMYYRKTRATHFFLSKKTPEYICFLFSCSVLFSHFSIDYSVRVVVVVIPWGEVESFLLDKSVSVPSWACGLSVILGSPPPRFSACGNSVTKRGVRQW